MFVRGAQPVIVNNVFRHNTAGGTTIAALSFNANAMSAELLGDFGRSRGEIDAFDQFSSNRGPLVRLNRLGDNDINGMRIRGATLTTESVWDDSDIVHVLQNSKIFVPDLHVYGGLRLQSSPAESLVVKSIGDSGIVSTGRPLDIDDRVGGMLHIVGQPGYPVVMTSAYDCAAGAGFTPEGLPQTETINGFSCGAVVTTNAPYADVIVVIDESSSMQEEQDFTETMIPQLDAALLAAGVGTGTSGGNRYGLVGFGGGGGFGGGTGPHTLGHSHTVGTGGACGVPRRNTSRRRRAS